MQPRSYEKVVRLMEKGATVPNPLTVDVGEEVDLARVAGEDVVLFPGCRMYGAETAISPGVRLGEEGPVTIVDCQLGPRVELRGGYFKQSVFLEKANVGLGAQVREGCLLEEEAGGAHCVGLKQTILFPFVTLGSLINFCDCLMAGGTSRRDHSEVGSSYIHFNYTPDGDKTTASLFGDVPRGVMLDQPPIFLGGQGGAVGPVRVGFGTVVAAGSILRHDILEDGKLVAAPPPADFVCERHPRAYKSLTRVVRNNIIYLANLVALEEWYRHVRAPFFRRQTMGELVYQGALQVLSLAREERTNRLLALAEHVPAVGQGAGQFKDKAGLVCALFAPGAPAVEMGREGLEFTGALKGAASAGYIGTIQGLPPALRAKGVNWLQTIVDTLCQRAQSLLPGMDLL